MNYPKIAALLVDRGARLDARNAKGDTPAMVAAGDAVSAVLRRASP
jgi:hypothetical protein